MRTTITIAPDVYREAKARAAHRSQTVSQLIEDAVRAALQADAAGPGELADLPVLGEGGVLPGIDLADRSGLLDVLDAGTALDAMR